MENRKFKPGQKVMAQQFLINGTRIDVDGRVERYVLNQALKKWFVEVVINDTRVSLHEDRIEDFDEFWRAKKVKEVLEKAEEKK